MSALLNHLSFEHDCPAARVVGAVAEDTRRELGLWRRSRDCQFYEGLERPPADGWLAAEPNTTRRAPGQSSDRKNGYVKNMTRWYNTTDESACLSSGGMGRIYFQSRWFRLSCM